MSNNVFFTADTHFGHGRIIQYCNRPFKNFEDQDEQMIQRFNSVINKGDRLYHLGDVAWSSYRLEAFTKRLKTTEIYLIKGNHDGHPNRVYEAAGFKWVKDLVSLSIGQDHFICCHYPLLTWLGRSRGAYMLYGHVHGRMSNEGRSMDVGVDTNNFYPYAQEDIVMKLKNKMFYKGEA